MYLPTHQYHYLTLTNITTTDHVNPLCCNLSLFWAREKVPVERVNKITSPSSPSPPLAGNTWDLSTGFQPSSFD